MHQHFTLCNSVLVSLPSTGQSYQHHRLLTDTPPADEMLLLDLMLQSMNEDSQWNICTSRQHTDTLDAEFRIPYYSDANVIFTWPEQGENEVLPIVLDQIEDIGGHPAWNPRALLLVVAICRTDEPEVLAHAVLETIWETYRIIDILLLIADSNVHLPASRNYILRDVKSDIYPLSLFTWYPFSVDNRVFRIANWVQENEGRIVREADLFSPKIPKNFNGLRLNVSAVFVYPLFDHSGNYTEDGSREGYKFTGPLVPLLHLILETLNLRGFYKPPTERQSAVSELVFGKTNLVIGGLVAHYKAVHMSDFVFPFFVTGVRAYVPCPQPVSRLQKVSEIFTLSAWLGIFFVLVFVTLSFLCLAKPPCNKDIHDSQPYRTVRNCIYSVWAVALGVSVTEQPRSDKLRVAFLFFVWYSFAVSTVFQTFFTSVLVDPGMGEQISSIDEILSSALEFGFYRIHDDDYLLNDSTDGRNAALKAKAKDCPYLEECLKRVIENRDFITLEFDLLVDHYVATNFPKSPNILCNIDDYIVQFSMTMYLEKGSPFLEAFNWVVHRAVEAGLVQKYFADSRYSWRMQGLSNMNDSGWEGKSDGGYFVFSLSHLVIAFIFLISGLLFSFFALILEIVHSRF
jgi:hypothetical protein